MNSFQQDFLYASSLLMQKAEISHDVYDVLLYALCLSTPARGAFLSLSGDAEYFDAVVGSYRADRIGKKGGIKIWEYDIPASGEKMRCKSLIWLYKAKYQGWLVGINSDADPDVSLMEGLILSASVAVEHIRKRENKIEGRDALTGLLDRGSLFRDLRHLMSIAGSKNIPLYLLFIDLNNFKTINDVLGHDTGDRVLASQAFEMRKQVKGTGQAYRYGGDEFCVVLMGMPEDHVVRIAKRLELASEQAPGGITVSASVGMALFEGEDIEMLIRKADTEMYNKKRERKHAAGSIH